MTSRKETLITILQQLVGYRDLAEGFLVLVQTSESEEFVEELYGFVKQQIKAVKDEQQKKLIKQQLKKVKARERKDLEEADRMLDDLLLDM